MLHLTRRGARGRQWASPSGFSWNSGVPFLGHFASTDDAHGTISPPGKDLLTSQTTSGMIWARQFQFFGWSQKPVPTYVLFALLLDMFAS